MDNNKTVDDVLLGWCARRMDVRIDIWLKMMDNQTLADSFVKHSTPVQFIQRGHLFKKGVHDKPDRCTMR